MKLQTSVPVDAWTNPITYGTPILLLGSCFTEHIGKRLEDSGFTTILNPHGISFNAAAVQQSLEDIMDERTLVPNDLVGNDGVWHHWDFHSSLSGIDPEEVACRMTASIQAAHQSLKQASHLLITLGTAWVYALKETGKVVNNCHKFPADHFDRKRLEQAEVMAIFDELFERLKEFNPDLQIVLTLSPVRHWKDGATENAVSKATLRLAIDELCGEYAHCEYFPAYEIMMDELRDYRFYADDMLHPNTIAQVIIWDRFIQAAMTEKDQGIAREVQAYHRMLAHRSLHPGSSADQTFKESIEERKSELQARYPQVHLA